MLHTQNDHLGNNFLNYLDNLGLSSKSFKNYKSDISHFTSWAILKVKSIGVNADNLADLLPFISDSLAKEYKEFLVKNNTSKKTVNRRLATLRHFSLFLNQSQLLEYNFMTGIENLSLTTNKKPIKRGKAVILKFKTYLENQNVSNNTIKNYLSDIGQFLTWLEENQPLGPKYE